MLFLLILDYKTESLKRTVAYQGHIISLIFRPQTLIYVENDAPFTFKKIG